MKLSWFYSLPKPRDTCRLMLIGIALYLVEFGLHIYYGEGPEE